MPRRENVWAPGTFGAAVSGVHAALIADYLNASRIIDPRLKVTDDRDTLDVIDQVLTNQGTVHSRGCRRIAGRLEDGEPVAVEVRRVRALVDADDLPPWMTDRATDPRTGVVVHADDTITRAGRDDLVHW